MFLNFWDMFERSSFGVFEAFFGIKISHSLKNEYLDCRSRSGQVGTRKKLERSHCNAHDSEILHPQSDFKQIKLLHTQMQRHDVHTISILILIKILEKYI